MIHLKYSKLVLSFAVAVFSFNGYTQELFLTQKHTGVFEERLLVVQLENDILTGSDRYFTNGVSIHYYNKRVQIKLLDRFLRMPKNGNSRYGISIQQNMYTPSKLNTSVPVDGDRPYAGYLLGTYRKERYVNKKKIKAELSLGMLGKYSGNEFTQNFVHQYGQNNQSNGWQSQVNNAPVVNIQYGFDFLFFQDDFSGFSGGTELRLGTLYTDVEIHSYLQFGKIERSFYNFGPKYQSRNRTGISASVYARPSAKLVVYDATLQGGVASLDPGFYTLTGSQINRLVFGFETGVNLQLKQFSMLIGVHQISPEFIGAERHKWGKISISYSF